MVDQVLKELIGNLDFGIMKALMIEFLDALMIEHQCPSCVNVHMYVVM